MNKKFVLLSAVLLFLFCGVMATKDKAKKTKIVAYKGPLVAQAMDIKNSIVIPVVALEKKSSNPLVKELATISDDLFKLAYNKIAAKHDAFVSAKKSFEPGLTASEFAFAYVESWIEMVAKRTRKIGEYKERLVKIQERLSVFDKKLDALKATDAQLQGQLANYSSQLKEKIAMTSEWIEKSQKLFTNELNMLNSRKKKFEAAGVPKA